MEGGAHVESVAGTKFPRLVCVGLVVDEEFVSKGAKWCGIVAMGAVEVLPGRYGSIQCILVD